MKTITIEIDDAFGEILCITASGRVGSTLNVTTYAMSLNEVKKVKIDEKGKVIEESEDEG
jgi:hypothetical protein